MLLAGNRGSASYLYPRSTISASSPQGMIPLAPRQSEGFLKEGSAAATGSLSSLSKPPVPANMSEASQSLAAKPRLAPLGQPVQAEAKKLPYKSAMPGPSRPFSPRPGSPTAAAAFPIKKALQPGLHQINGHSSPVMSHRLPSAASPLQTVSASPVNGTAQRPTANFVDCGLPPVHVPRPPLRVPFEAVGSPRALPSAGVGSNTSVLVGTSFRPQISFPMMAAPRPISMDSVGTGLPLAFKPINQPPRFASASFHTSSVIKQGAKSHITS